MELITPPAYTEEVVTDLTFGFTSGAMKDLTLRAGETYSGTPTEVVVTLNTGEVITLYKASLAWQSTFSRVIRTPVGKPVIAVVEGGQ